MTASTASTSVSATVPPGDVIKALTDAQRHFLLCYLAAADPEAFGTGVSFVTSRFPDPAAGPVIERLTDR